MTGFRQTLHNRRGFTLVELIVTLVILGVLGTFTVPALTGYIDSSKEKQAVSETQACVETATRLAAQQYAKAQQLDVSGSLKGETPLNNLNGWVSNKNSNTSAPNVTGDLVLTEGTGHYFLNVKNPPPGNLPATGSTDIYNSILSGAGVPGTLSRLTFNANGQLLYLVYTSKDSIQVVYTNSGTTATVKNEETGVVVPKPDNNAGGGDTGGGDAGGGDTGGGGTGGTGGGTGGTGGGSNPGVSDGDLIFYIKDQDATDPDKAGIAGVEFEVVNKDTNEIVGTATTDSDGKVSFKVNLDNDVAAQGIHTASDYKLVPKSWPAGCQEIFDIDFTIVPCEKDNHNWSNAPENFYIAITYDENAGQPASDKTTYRRGTAEEHTYTFYNPQVIYATINKVDEYGNKVKNAVLQVSQNINGQKNEFTVDTNNCPKKIAIKMHDRDNIPAGYNFLRAGNNVFIKETTTPIGYKEIMTSEVVFYQRFNLSNTQNPNIQITDDGYGINVIDYHKETCMLTVYFVDDFKNEVTGMEYALSTPGTSEGYINESGTTSLKNLTANPLQVEVKRGATYKLEESKKPDGCDILSEQTISVGAEEYNKVVYLYHHNYKGTGTDIVVDNKITFPSAVTSGWDHKLTTDETIKLNGDILSWKGEWYFCYKDIDNLANKYFKKIPLPEDTPDPITFVTNSAATRDGNDYVVKLTGKAYSYTDTTATLERGDILIPPNADSKIYVYYGSDPLKVSDVGKDYTGFKEINRTTGSGTKLKTNYILSSSEQ